VTHQYTTSLFESNCNSVGNSIRKNLLIIVLFGFFLTPSIRIGISSVYTDDIFPSLNTNGVSDGKKSVGKDQRKIPIKKFIDVFICVHRFSSSVSEVTCGIRDGLFFIFYDIFYCLLVYLFFLCFICFDIKLYY
jgi:hypothetical protein